MTDYFVASSSGIKLKCEPAYDEQSKCHLVYGSFILNSVLQSNYLSLHEEWTRNWTQDVAKKLSDTNITFFLSGSTSEHLNLPVNFSEYKEKTPEYLREHVYMSDQDVMVCPENIPLVDERREVNIRPSLGTRLGVVRVLPTTHPGYLLIEVNTENDLCRYSTLVNGRHYLNGDDLTKDIISKLKCIKVTQEGPALAINDNVIKIRDLVLSFRAPAWPQEANDFVHRSRPNGWPNGDLVSSIANSGCHVVRMGHHKSTQQEIELRWSFSAAETKLAQTLSQHHRRPYLFLKMLYNQWLKQPKVLATYHLKTTLFWTIEKANPSLWEPGRAAHALIQLMDALLVSLGKYCIPNFFIPTNNMISHVNHADIDTIAEKIRDLRRDPIGHVLKFLAKNCFVVPLDTYVVVPPQEELRVWQQMPYRKRPNDGGMSTVAINFHRCAIHLALSWLVEITANCRAQNERHLKGISRRVYGCVLEAIRVGYEHEVDIMTKQNVRTFAEFVRVDMAETVRQFSGSQKVTTTGQVNLPDIFRDVLEYGRRENYL